MTAPTFRRYTDLAATIQLLRTKALTLLNPANWDDKNDAYYMAEYKRLKGAQTVLALCFAEAYETYHHWRVYAHGACGACVVFSKAKVVQALDADPELRTGYVHYTSIKELKTLSTINADYLALLEARSV